MSEPTEVVNVQNTSHAESPISTNIFLVGESGADIQLTVRSGATADEIQNVLDVLVSGLKYANEKYGLKPKGAHRSQPAQPAPSAPPPTLEGNAPGITSLSFQADKLVAEIKGNQKYWKIVGAPFGKYGVRIWPEVLGAAGFAVDQLVESEYTLSGYTAHYCEKGPGKPDKVTSLVKNA